MQLEIELCSIGVNRRFTKLLVDYPLEKSLEKRQEEPEMSLKFEITRRRLTYIRLANRELYKDKNGSAKIVNACDRLTCTAVKHVRKLQNVEVVPETVKPAFIIKADGSIEAKDTVAIITNNFNDVA